jgi:hypothetical protein
VDPQRHACDAAEWFGFIVGLGIKFRFWLRLVERERLWQRQVQRLVDVEFWIQFRIELRQFVGPFERERQRLWAARIRLGLRQRPAVGGARRGCIVLH